MKRAMVPGWCTLLLILTTHYFGVFSQRSKAFTEMTRGNLREDAAAKRQRYSRAWLENAEDLLVSKRQSEAPGATSKPWLELEGIPPSRIPVRLHSDITIECQAVGSPPPVITWLKNGKPLDATSGFHETTNQVYKGENGISLEADKSGFVMSKVKAKLPLRCIRPEDEAEYTCVADNDGRQLRSSTVVVIEEDDPSGIVYPECAVKLATLQFNKKGKGGVPAHILSAETLHMAPIGSNVLLPCRGAGHPKPQITWVDAEGQHIAPGKKYQMTSSGQLLIRSLSWGDMGEYSCVAENPFGNDLSSTFVYPLQTEEQ